MPDFTGADAVEPCKDKADRIFGKQAQNAVDDAGRHPVHCRAAEQQRDDQQVDDIADH